MPGKSGYWPNIGNIKLWAIKWELWLIMGWSIKRWNTLQLIEAFSPRKRNRPDKILSGNETSAYDDVCDVKTFYKNIYFNVIDTVASYTEGQFWKAGCHVLRNIKQFLLNVVSQLDYKSQLSDVVGFYRDEVNSIGYQYNYDYLELGLFNLIKRPFLVLSAIWNNVLASKENSLRKLLCF